MSDGRASSSELTKEYLMIFVASELKIRDLTPFGSLLIRLINPIDYFQFDNLYSQQEDLHLVSQFDVFLGSEFS